MFESRLISALSFHERDLMQFLTVRLKSAFTAQDLIQDLYLKLRGLGERPEIRDERAFLFRMARNLAIDHLRGEGRRSELLQEAHAFLGEEASQTSPESALIARQELACLEAALAELPELSRRIFHLTRFEGLSQREVAATVGLSNTAVFKHLRKVFDHLAKVRS